MFVCSLHLVTPRGPYQPGEGPGGGLGRGGGVSELKVVLFSSGVYSKRRCTDKGCLPPSEADRPGQPGGEEAGSERNGGRERRRDGERE